MLVDKTDIINHVEISKGVKDAKKNPYIKNAERLDLRPLLGELLYNDLVKNPTDTENVKLLDPFEYTYEGNLYNHEGLKKVLCLFAGARYFLYGSFTDTPFGYVQKNTPDSTPGEYNDRKSKYTNEKQIAMSFYSDVEKFLNRNSSLFPLWDNGNCSTNRRSGMRLTKITK